MKVVKRILLVLIALLIVIFAVQNSGNITIKLFDWSMTLPVSLLIILVYFLGMTTGGILFSIIRRLAQDSPVQEKEEEEQ